jgi:diguanylate cyclase (GGDEF)-like protein
MDKLIQLMAQHSLPEFISYTQNLMAMVDPSGALLEWNPAFGALLTAMPAATRLPELLTPASQLVLAEMLLAGQPRQSLLQLASAQPGSDFACLLHPLPDGNFLFVAEPDWKSRDDEIARLVNELSELKRIIEIKKIELESVLVQANEVSHTDALTFLPNRRQIIADLQREVMACDRYRKPLTIFMLDIDHFKRINDTYGHTMGDKALQSLSLQMLAVIRKLDKLGRYGGEEFLILLPATAIKSAIKLADRLLQVTRAMSIALENDQSVSLTISIGIAQYRIGKENWDDVLRRADKALYRAKSNGRDQWTVANSSDNGIISSRSPRDKKSE